MEQRSSSLFSFHVVLPLPKYALKSMRRLRLVLNFVNLTKITFADGGYLGFDSE